MSRATGIGNRHAHEAVSHHHDRIVRTSACMQEVYGTAQRIARSLREAAILKYVLGEITKDELLRIVDGRTKTEQEQYAWNLQSIVLDAVCDKTALQKNSSQTTPKNR